MNNSSVKAGELVQKINDEHVRLFISAIVFTCILMITGLVGNSMVVYYYGFKAKRTPTYTFILALAVYDLMACTVAMPHEIVLSLKFYTYINRSACKSVFFISYFVVLASGLTLPAIAVDRYRHICCSTLYQTTVNHAMKHCVIVAMAALILSWPLIIFYDIEVAPLPSKYGPGLQGSSCSISEACDTYNMVLDVVHFIIFLLCMAMLVVLYFRISKVLYIHHRHFGRTEITTGTRISNNHSKRIDNMTTRVTIGIIVMTTVFFLSYIPGLCLTVWRSIKGKREGQFLSGAELVGFQIGRQSYMLNSSLNPWIYGIFNSEFRHFYYRKLCRRSRDTTGSISRETFNCTHAEQTV